MTILADLTIPAVSLSEQSAISRVLGALDDKISVNRRTGELVRQLLDARWTQVQRSATSTVELDEIAQLNPRTMRTNGATAPFVDMKSLPQGALLIDSWGEREPRSGARFINGDTLLARITPCFENGKLALVDFLDSGQTGTGSTEFIVMRPKPGVPAVVPFLIAQSSDFRDHAAKTMTGTSGRQRVQASGLADYVLSWPDKAELDQFTAFAEPVTSLLGRLRSENQTLARTRDELLPLLMDGRITVKQAEDSAGEVL
ncbi:hypothetical protein ACH46_20470 [Gordonia phthalatica]|uniref:Type I restriction modification DNA specificity domain-containing protein n=1 Tax=Gordonia phthalatica TaxID=1136941 RepID=A0A0N9MWI1_9ACTN|nr:hypothetical protein ACH46_20470 [Gordonia phthalatica]